MGRCGMDAEELTKAVLARDAEPTPFRCAECKYHFKNVGEAETASFTEAGCPKCGGSEIERVLEFVVGKAP